MAMYGADSDALDRLSEQVAAAAQTLAHGSTLLRHRLYNSAWVGQDAVSFQREWDTQHRTTIRETVGFLNNAAQQLKDQARAQREASAGLSGGATNSFSANPVTGTESSARSTVAAILKDLAEGRPPNGTFEIRQLSDGRYIVILPGVQDLTKGIDEGADAAKRDALQGAAIGGGFGAAVGAVSGFVGTAAGEWMAPSGTNRDMSNAIPNHLLGTANPYSAAVKQALHDAGVPPGAEIMLVGHSYGAMTAVDLAADKSFNQTSGAAGTYHISHVVAVGADTGWRANQIPEGTDALIANNRQDTAVLAEEVRHKDTVGHPGVMNVDFDGDSWKGAGHDPSIYSSYIRAESPELSGWMSSLGDSFSGSGTSVQPRV